jgi:hypothetical protein
MDGQAPQSASTSGEQEGRKLQQSRTGRPGARPAVRNFHFPSESKEALVQNHFFFFFFFLRLHIVPEMAETWLRPYLGELLLQLLPPLTVGLS